MMMVSAQISVSEWVEMWLMLVMSESRWLEFADEPKVGNDIEKTQQ